MAPWEIEQAPADRVSFYFNVLAAEAKVLARFDGVEPGEDVTLFGWSDEEE